MITVIVPVFRAEKYIESCVNSILAQSFQDFELILVDDGSPDRSGEICDRLVQSDDRIRVIHKSNGGAATARNAGLDVAKGDYIAFVDGDDLVHPQYLQYLQSLLEQSGADIAMCHYDFFARNEDLRDQPLDCSAPEYTLQDCKQMLSRFTDHYRRVSLISLCMKLFQKEIFSDLRIPEGQTAEDSLVLPMILEKAGKLVKSSAKLYHWRETPDSVTRGGINLNYMHRINIGDFYVRFFTERKDKAQAAYFKREFLLRVLTQYYRISREKPELLKDFKPYMKKFRSRFLNYWLTAKLSVRERLVYALFRIHPGLAQREFLKVYGEGLN